MEAKVREFFKEATQVRIFDINAHLLDFSGQLYLFNRRGALVGEINGLKASPKKWWRFMWKRGKSTFRQALESLENPEAVYYVARKKAVPENHTCSTAEAELGLFQVIIFRAPGNLSIANWASQHIRG